MVCFQTVLREAPTSHLLLRSLSTCSGWLQAVRDPSTGEVGFNVELGGYFSIKRNVMSLRCVEQGACGRAGCVPAGRLRRH